MKLLLLLIAPSVILPCCKAFLQPPPSFFSVVAAAHEISRSRFILHGIQEWRDQAFEYKYTLDGCRQSNPLPSRASSVPATIPVLPFPFSDILLQGQRTQLNLYEQRFHELFKDAMDNHCEMLGMGLLAGNGMVTTLPLCEVESYSTIGVVDNWVDKGDGMGNGSIFVTIRAVGRAKIVESDLLQEDPYMKARVVELLDDDISMEEGTGLKEKSNTKLSGESSPLSVANSVADNIETMLVSLASMEHKLQRMKEKKKTEEKEETNTVPEKIEDEKDDGDEVMERILVNAQLESLFMKDSRERVDSKSAVDDEFSGEDDNEHEAAVDETEVKLGRVFQFQQAFESAIETDTFGYVLQPVAATDNLSQKGTKQSIRTAKDLVAVSWAAFCTGDNNCLQRDVMKIQALDMTNVLQRLHLASAMLREEKKKWMAKLALAGINTKGES